MNIATEGSTEKKTCIVVDENDQVLKIGNLAECHTRPMALHRAFSLFVFDEEGRMLLQQRAKTKYTFPLAWTNTVCSHPRNLEKSLENWVDLRVQDELGWAIKDIENRLQPVGKLTYEAFSDAIYGEKEIDTLFFLQISNDEKVGIEINRDEIEAIDWVEPKRLESMLRDDRYLITPWFRACADNTGYPLYTKMRQRAESTETMSKPENDDNSGAGNPEETKEDSSRGLPWYRVGNCSMPSANSENDLLLQQPFSYLCSNPGKSLRSELVKLYGDVDTDLSEQDVEGLCWIVERVHNASLLHDDIEDKSTSRRGAVCAHLLWGTAQVINTGTFNFLQAIQGVDEKLAHHDVSKRSEIMRQVLAMEMDLHRGQNADIVWGEYSLCPSIAQYLEMINNKTGALFRACATLGAACTGNSELGTQVAAWYGELGTFFQIRDDLCNVCDPIYWKAKGFYEDADEGKYSYPVLLYFESAQADEEQKQWLKDRLANRTEPMDIKDKLRAYTLLHDAGVLNETRDLCLTMLTSLQESLATRSQRAAKILQILYVVEILSPQQVQKLI